MNTNLNNVRAVFKCPEEYKKHFHNSHCLLTISVGQEVHEENKFLETIQLVGNNFKKCTILIDDSLQRHTMALALGGTADSCYERSIEEGIKWLQRNEKIYTRLPIPYNIIHWDKWLKHPLYKEQHNYISDTYINDPYYRQEINNTIDEFINRYLRRLNDTNAVKEEVIRETCLNYLKEECTALCLWAEDKYNFEVYPSKRNAAMTATHEKFIITNGTYLLYPVAIKFKNRKQLKPQFDYEKLINSEAEIVA